MNYENSKVVNYTSLRDMILEDGPPVHVHNPKKIERKHGGIVVSEPETKEYNFYSLPYGYYLFIYLFIFIYIFISFIYFCVYK